MCSLHLHNTRADLQNQGSDFWVTQVSRTLGPGKEFGQDGRQQGLIMTVECDTKGAGFPSGVMTGPNDEYGLRCACH